jgi:hypothetical protein
MLRLLSFLCFILGGLALFICGARTIEPWCTAPDWNQNNIQNKGSKNESTKQNQQPPDNITITLQSVKPDNKSDTAENERENKPWYSLGWWKKFFCESKIGDLAVAYFTYCLVVVGAFETWDVLSKLEFFNGPI